MPDRYGDRDGIDQTPAHLDADPAIRAHAIVICDLCDDDGYRGTVVCDHVDHAAAAQRGMALVREALGTRDTRQAPKVAQISNRDTKKGTP